jgi:hypothetical protein
MFNLYFRPFVPGFRVRPQNDVPGFNLDENSGPSERGWPNVMRLGTATPRYPDAAQALAQPILGLPTPSPDFLVQSALPTGLAQFRAARQDDVLSPERNMPKSFSRTTLYYAIPGSIVQLSVSFQSLLRLSSC